jgi:DNA (cytosine-5)-methyltransferase 1
MRTHIDLFSGIGGFTLAASWYGIKTVAFCEIDKRCRDFLGKAWPGIPCHDDIRTFDGRQFSDIFLLAGGVPCQAASRAGKQRGKDDDRWLWPEAVRVLGEVRPTWALFENPPGIGDVGLARILAEMEGLGYEVRVFGIPACAVGAPHRRERYWIVAHAESDTAKHNAPECNGWFTTKSTGTDGGNLAHAETRQDDSGEMGHLGEEENCREGSDSAAGSDCQSGVAYAEDSKSKPVGFTNGGMGNPLADANYLRPDPTCSSQGDLADTEGQFGRSRAGRRHREEPGNDNSWSNFTWLPCADGKFRRAPDDSFGLVDGLHRSLLGALGNSIVPQVAERIIRAMIEADR